MRSAFRISLALACLVLCSNSCRAQFPLLDSIREELQKPSSFFVALDGRNTVVEDFPGTMYGFMYGWDYGRLLVGTGIYGMKPFTLTSRVGTDTIRNAYDFSYISSTLEYSFHETRKWRLSLPLQIGIGYGDRKKMINSTVAEHKRPLLIPGEAAFRAVYKATRYVGLSAGVGLRVSLVNSSNFDGPIYYFGLSFFWGNIKRDIMKKRR